MGCFPCCEPHHQQGSIGGNSGKTGNTNQPGMPPGLDRPIEPGTGTKFVPPGAMPSQHGIGRFGPYWSKNIDEK